MDLTPEEKAGLLELCYEDPVEFCKTFLPTKFTKPIPWLHRGILAIITGRVDFLLKYGELDTITRHFVWSEDPDNPDAPEHPIFKVHLDDEGNPVKIDMDRTKYAEFIMPRGFSKTTLIGLACMLYKILYQEETFIVYISETATAAELQLGNVKAELAGNELIHYCFGDLRPDRNSELKWTGTFIQTVTGIVATARGRGGQIRGLNVGGQRPTCILFDDVEDKESVRTPEQREKTKDWFYADTMPAIDRMDPNATIYGLGTVLHREALLMVLKYDPEWTTIIFGATDKDGEATWPDNMTLADIAAKKKSYALNGMLAQFYMEYESQIRPEEGAAFNPSMFYLRPEFRGELEAIAQVLDPAISEKPGADGSGLVAAGMTSKGFILVLDEWYKVGATPREQIDTYFEFSHRHQTVHHGVEGIAYQRALIHIMREEMFRKGQYFDIKDIRHGKTAKDERIKGVLQGRYANGYIAHARKLVYLETQLLDYPNGKKDVPDALAMTITLLDPYAAAACDPEVDLEADEYEPLGAWRQH